MSDHRCNKCGKSCIPEAAATQGVDDMYGLQAEFTTGYFSPVLPDANLYQFNLCEPCVAAFMKTFKIPPKGFCWVTKGPCAPVLDVEAEE